MKTTSLLTLPVLFVFFACNAGARSGDPSVRFGIHETLRKSELPASIMDSLKVEAFRPEDDLQSSIVGYWPKDHAQSCCNLFSGEGFRLLKACFPVDQEGQYQAVVAVKQEPVLSLSDIQKTSSKGSAVEIYFTLEGARKWAAMTEGNIGKSVAFVIDDQVYSMPMINGVIKSGIAVISGLPDETAAKEISDRLNEGL